MISNHQPKTRLNPKNCISKRHSITLSVALSLLPSFAAWSSAEQTSEVLKLSENKRIEASICASSMNRIAVANDRITQIFGDEGTFESQNDEATGQVFLKPTVDNGSKNLSLTLITEQGVTQDLTLKPTATSPKTIILGRDPLSRDSLGHGTGYQDAEGQNFSAHTYRQINPDTPWQLSHGNHLALRKVLPVQEESRSNQILTLLKQAIAGQLHTEDTHVEDSRVEDQRVGDPQAIDGRMPQHPSRAGCSLTPSQSRQAGPYAVHAFHVENVTETPLEIEEKDFYQPGDLALSFGSRVLDAHGSQKHVLTVQGKTTIYVVRPRKADLP
jgi:hypothetical protein